MPPPQDPGPLSRSMHTHLLMHPTRLSHSDWWAPPQPLPSVAAATPPLACSSHQEAHGKQARGLSLFRETPLSPALSCPGTLPGARPLSLRPALKTPPSPHPSSPCGGTSVVGKAVTGPSSCTPPMASLGQGLSMLSPAPSPLFPGQLSSESVRSTAPATCQGLSLGGRGGLWLPSCSQDESA